MNPNLTSAVSEFSKGRTERSNKPSLRTLVQNLIARIRLWLGKLVSFAFARVLMIFVVGFAAGVAWQSYGGEARKTIARLAGPHTLPGWPQRPPLLALLPSGSRRPRSLSPRRGKASTSSPLRLASCRRRIFPTRGRHPGVPANVDFTTSSTTQKSPTVR